jgi:Tfp pilus assembly protein PilW
MFPINKKPVAVRRRRHGMSLLELVVATSMLAMVMGAVSMILRTSRQAWEAHEGDYTRVEAAHATLRHLVREVRQADAVTAISVATDNSGQLGLLMPAGVVRVWDHDASTNTVNFTATSGNGLLAADITGLRLTGYKPDGTTATTVPDEVQFLKIDVSIELPREANGAREVSSYVWVRAW